MFEHPSNQILEKITKQNVSVECCIMITFDVIVLKSLPYEST